MEEGLLAMELVQYLQLCVSNQYTVHIIVS